MVLLQCIVDKVGVPNNSLRLYSRTYLAYLPAHICTCSIICMLVKTCVEEICPDLHVDGWKLNEVETGVTKQTGSHAVKEVQSETYFDQRWKKAQQ